MSGVGVGHKRKRRRMFLWFERASLGAGMSVVAFIIERRLLKALRAGGVKSRPEAAQASAEREAQLTTAPQEVGYQPQR